MNELSFGLESLLAARFSVRVSFKSQEIGQKDGKVKSRICSAPFFDKPISKGSRVFAISI